MADTVPEIFPHSHLILQTIVGDFDRRMARPIIRAANPIITAAAALPPATLVVVVILLLAVIVVWSVVVVGVVQVLEIS